MTDTTQKISSTERVRRHREKIRQEGWVMVEVKVPTDRIEDLRAYAKKLGRPKPKVIINQMPLFPDLK